MNIRGLTVVVLPYLQDGDLLSYRSSTRAILEETKQIKPIYKSKIQFAVAVSGVFENKEEFEDAWQIYSKTTQHPDVKHPSVLYKRREPDINAKLDRLDFRQRMYSDGGIYTPKKHTWKANAIWILAQIQMGRSFQLISELSPDFIRRKEEQDVFSALAKEVTLAIQANYKIVAMDSNHYITLKPSKNTPKHLTLADVVDPTNKQIRQSIKKVNTKKNFFIKVENKNKKKLDKEAKENAHLVHSYAKEVANYSLHILQEFITFSKEQIEHEVKNQLSFFTKNKNLMAYTVDRFIRIHNDTCEPSFKKIYTERVDRILSTHEKMQLIFSIIAENIMNIAHHSLKEKELQKTNARHTF